MRLIIAILLIFTLTACNSPTESTEKATSEINEETKEVVKFESVEEAELYLWENAKKDMPYSEIEKILSEGSFVSKSDYDKVVTWYEELERANEIVQNVNESMKDWTVEDGMSIKKDGGWITRYETQEIGGFTGYELEFVKEDGTFKLEKITMLQ